MRIKICGIKNSEDATTALNAGADAVGFLVGQIHKSPDFILPSTAGRLAAALPPFITPVLVTHLNEVEDILDIIGKSSITTVQLHGRLSVDQVKEINDNLPSSGKIILATYISKGNEPDIVEYYPFINAVLLDAHNLSAERIEVERHEEFYWEEAAEFVKSCPLPVILAGGLGVNNVKEAISIVKPYAIDANRELKEDQGGACCPYHCKSFVQEAQQ